MALPIEVPDVRIYERPMSIDPVWPVTFSPKPFRGRSFRAWSDRRISELKIGLGWKQFAGEVVGFIEEWPDFSWLFPVAMPLINTAPDCKVGWVRFYKGWIETDSCKKQHECAVYDPVHEDNYRLTMPDGKPAQRRRRSNRMALELVLPERCPCFWDGKVEHEGSVKLWRM